MQYLTLALAASALVAPSFAAPTTESVPSGYQWNVKNWEAGCTNTACTYDFTVAGPEDGKFPGFKAHCAGTDNGEFVQCTLLKASTTSSVDPEVFANLAPVAEPNPETTVPAKMAVNFQFKNHKVEYSYTGFHKAGFNMNLIGGNVFAVAPTEASAVV